MEVRESKAINWHCEEKNWELEDDLSVYFASVWETGKTGKTEKNGN
jgi:hypothetical protein